MEIVGVIILVVLAVPVGLLWALYRVSKLESALGELKQEILLLRRQAARRQAAEGGQDAASTCRSSRCPSCRARPTTALIGWGMDRYVGPPRGLTGLETSDDIQASLPTYVERLAHAQLASAEEWAGPTTPVEGGHSDESVDATPWACRTPPASALS